MVGPNNTTNDNEAAVNSKQKQENLHSKLVREYCKYKLSHKSERTNFVNDIRSADSLSDDQIADIKRFAGRFPDLDGIEISKEILSHVAFIRETNAFFSTIKNNRQTIEDSILLNYDTNRESVKKKLGKHIENLRLEEQEKILSSEKELQLFLKKGFGENGLKSKSLTDTLKKFNLLQTYESLDEGNKVDFGIIVDKIQSGKQIDEYDISMLFVLGVYTRNEKKELIQKLVPSISLAQAKNFGFWSQDEVLNYKISVAQEIDPKLSKDQQKEIALEMSDKDIKISTENFLQNPKQVQLLSENAEVFENFSREYNTKLQENKEKINASGVQKKDDFVTELTKLPNVRGVENLKTGSIVVLNQQSDGTDSVAKVLYGEIVSVGDNGVIEFVEKGEGEFDHSGLQKTQERYSDFVSYLQSGNAKKGVSGVSAEFITQSELDARIKSGVIAESNAEKLLLQDKKQIQNTLLNTTQSIEDLKKQLKETKNKLAGEFAKQRKTQAEIDTLTESDPNVITLKKQIDDLKKQESLLTQNLSNVDQSNIEKLISNLDDKDPDGKKYGLEKGVVLKTSKGDYFSIVSIDPIGGKVGVKGLKNPEIVSFEDFFEGFQAQGAKRIMKAEKDFESFISFAGTESSYPSEWKNSEFKDGKIQKKNTKTSIGYDYLASTENEELIKIHQINGDMIRVSFGKINSKTRKDDKDKAIKSGGKTVKDYTFSVEKESYEMTFAALQARILDEKLEPRSLDEGKDKEITESIESRQEKVNLGTLLFHNRVTLQDVIKGGSMFFEQFQGMLDKGSEERASQFADTYLSAFLPADMKRDIQSRMEQSQKKSMEDLIERLKTVGSDVAVNMIDGWLHDPYAPQYQTEAAAMFMIEKYGVLNSKGLEKYEGKYLFYQALGGKIGDDLYLEIKEEMKDANLPFTEEYLVYILIKRQCAPSGFKGIKRRSKLHKEFKKLRAQGKDEEIESGKNDGGDERTIDGRVRGALGEMKNNNYPNMAGWLEKAIDKGGPMHLMNKVPFIAAFSGVAYTFEEKITDHLKNFPANSGLIMALRFFSYQSDLKLLNKTILHICKSLEEKSKQPGKYKGKYTGIESKAQEIFDNQTGSGVKGRIEKTEKFYDTYGEVLTKIMYMLNTGDVDDDLNKLIFFEKDEDSERGRVFTEYYSTLKEVVDADTEFSNEDRMQDPFAMAGTSGFGMKKFTKQLLSMRQGIWSKDSAGPIAWREIQSEFEALPKRQYDPDEKENDKMIKKVLKNDLRYFLAGLTSKIGQNLRELEGYNAPTSPFAKLRTWGINMNDLVENEINEQKLVNGDASADHILDTFVSRIIESERTGKDFSHLIKGEFLKPKAGVHTIGQAVSGDVSQALNQKPANNRFDNEYDTVAQV